MTDSFTWQTGQYQNTAEVNDRIFNEFTAAVQTVPWLRVHRDVVEHNQWGTGDRAFHWLWYLLIQEAARRFGSVALLEIGVFKGQVISLWSLIARRLGLQVAVTAVSPMQGTVARVPRGRFGHRMRMVLDPNYRSMFREGNVYESVDYAKIVNEVFATFELDFQQVKLFRGLSQDVDILKSLNGRLFQAVYIDGDHSYEGAKADIENYSAHVAPGGWLIMDDAACDCPGRTFWKGHQSVSQALAAADMSRFRNVLNVGHNRVFERVG